jgi:hypothetical protein
MKTAIKTRYNISVSPGTSSPANIRSHTHTPKETKKDRERRLKKAEELTDAPTDGPTDDDDEPEDELAYDAKGGLIKPGTSPEGQVDEGVAEQEERLLRRLQGVHK